MGHIEGVHEYTQGEGQGSCGSHSMVCGEGQALPVPMAGLITLRCFITSPPLYAQCVGQDAGVHATTQDDGHGGVRAHCLVVSSGQVFPVPQFDLVIL